MFGGAKPELEGARWKLPAEQQNDPSTAIPDTAPF